MNESKLISIARKKSSDPAQEQLRQHKQVWNDSASSLISKLIAFKRALNGRQDPKFNIPTSKIQDPLPHEVGDFLNKLTDEYSQLLNVADQIIEEQENYSQNRRKSQPQPQRQPQPQSADDGLVANAGIFDFLKKDPDKKTINNLRDTTIHAIKRIQEIQNNLSDMDPSNITKALLVMYSYQDAFNFMKRFLEKYCSSKGFDLNFDKPTQTTLDDLFGESDFSISEELPYIEPVLQDVKKLLSSSDISLYKNLYSALKKETASKELDSNAILETYNKLLSIVNEKIN